MKIRFFIPIDIFSKFLKAEKWWLKCTGKNKSIGKYSFYPVQYPTYDAYIPTTISSAFSQSAYRSLIPPPP